MTDIFFKELNVDKKEFLSQDEIKRVKELLKIVGPTYSNSLQNIQANSLMAWCLKVCTTYEVKLDEFKSKRKYSLSFLSSKDQV